MLNIGFFSLLSSFSVCFFEYNQLKNQK